MKRVIDVEEVRAKFSYHPNLGELKRYRKLITGGKVSLNGILISTAQLIWVYMTGEQPKNVLRIDRDPNSPNYNVWSNFTIPTEKTKSAQTRSTKGKLTNTLIHSMMTYDIATDTLTAVNLDNPSQYKVIINPTWKYQGMEYKRKDLIYRLLGYIPEKALLRD